MNKKEYMYQDICEKEIELFEKLRTLPQPAPVSPWKYYQACFERVFGNLKNCNNLRIFNNPPQPFKITKP